MILFRTIFISIIGIAILTSQAGLSQGHSASQLGWGRADNPYSTQVGISYYEWDASGSTDYHWTRTKTTYYNPPIEFDGTLQGQMCGQHIYAASWTHATRNVFRLGARNRLYVTYPGWPDVLSDDTGAVYQYDTGMHYNTSVRTRSTSYPAKYYLGYYSRGNHTWVIKNGNAEISIPTTYIFQFPVGCGF